MLHLTKVAYGAQSLDEMMGWFATRGAEAHLTTRNLPKRHAEIVPGGSLYWVLKHQLVARSPVLRFEARDDGRTDIVIGTALVRVRPMARRAHQGWRYLEATDTPVDLGEGDSAELLPPALAGDLARLGLI